MPRATAAPTPIRPPPAPSRGSRKRPNGDGSFRYVPERARWEGRYHVELPDGRRVRRSVYAPTEAAARAKVRAAQRDAERGLASESETVGQFLTRWLATIRPPALAPRTYIRYEELLTLHVIPTLGSKRLDRLTPAQVQALWTSKLQTLSPRTVQQMRAVLRRALHVGEQWGVVSRNVAAISSGPKQQRSEVEPFTPEQATAFLAAIRDHPDAALYVLAISTGMRAGELLGLRWTDIDWTRGVLRVEVQLQRYGGAYHLDPLKTARSRRRLRLATAVLDVLRAHERHQADDQARAGQLWEGADWGLVFCTALGGPRHGTAMLRTYQRVLAAAGLPPRRFHDLRHTFASLRLEQGAGLIEVKDALGHSSIAVTSNTYAHLTDGMKQSGADAMGAWLAGTTTPAEGGRGPGRGPDPTAGEAGSSPAP